jgi:hypothetical protein
MAMRLALLIVVVAIAPSAFAGDVYKCQDAAGRIEFRDRPCDATQKAQKVDITPNSVQTMTLEEVRARSAELKARQQARKDAESKADADAYAAQQWASQRDRALQDAIDPQQAVRDSGASDAGTQYYGGYGQPLRPPATPSPPPPLPNAPAMPAAPPKPPR